MYRAGVLLFIHLQGKGTVYLCDFLVKNQKSTFLGLHKFLTKDTTHSQYKFLCDEYTFVVLLATILYSI